MMKLSVQPDLLHRSNKNYWIAGFILLYFLSGFINLGYLPLNNEEPRRAIVSIEMLESGNYIMPTTLGWEYYNKPPVYNWIMSFFMKLSGSTSETVVRFPSLLFLLIWGICNYYIMRKLVPSAVALLSSFFLITSLDIFFWGLGNGGEIDIFYSFIVYLQVMSIFYFNHQKRWISLFTYSYLFCAIGFLTKGFPSILFEGLTLAALCAYNKSIRVFFKWQHLAGIGIFVAVVGGYLYIYNFYSSSNRLLANLLKESFNKSGLGERSERVVKKIFEYPVSFFKILLPWSLLLLLLFKKHSFRLWSNPIIRFSILFFLFNIPVYWLTGSPRMRYVYMFVPFAMIIFAFIFYEFKKEFPKLIDKILRYVSLIFVLVVAGLIASAFLIKLNYIWLGLSLLLFILYFGFYKRMKMYRVWYFATGIVLSRLVYALVFIPVSYEYSTVKYNEQMKKIAVANNYRPVNIYGKPEMLDLAIDLKVSKLKFGTIPTLPWLAYQMPYYYFRNTGQLMKYDTVLTNGQNYIGLGSTIKEMNPDVIYSFEDKNQGKEQVMLFRIQDQYSSQPEP